MSVVGNNTQPPVPQTYTFSQLFPEQAPTHLKELVTRITSAVSAIYEEFTLEDARDFADRRVADCFTPRKETYQVDQLLCLLSRSKVSPELLVSYARHLGYSMSISHTTIGQIVELRALSPERVSSTI
jgi:hypothetical protein